MPGPVSDSYDPEFGTGANAHDVQEGIAEVTKLLTPALGRELKNIVDVVQGEEGASFPLTFTERQLRIIRFCLIRSYESI